MMVKQKYSFQSCIFGIGYMFLSNFTCWLFVSTDFNFLHLNWFKYLLIITIYDSFNLLFNLFAVRSVFLGSIYSYISF